MDFIKSKNFCPSKNITTKKEERQTTEWEKIFANHLSNKGLKAYINNFYNSAIERQIIQFKNEQRIWIHSSPNKVYKWPISTSETCSRIFVITEMQMKTIMRYCFPPTSMAINKKRENKKNQRCGQIRTFILC